MNKPRQKERAKKRQLQPRLSSPELAFHKRREERLALLENLYGNKPFNEYDQWQIKAMELIQDGIDRDKAESYSKKREELVGKFYSELVGNDTGQNFEHLSYIKAMEKADQILPCPVSQISND